VDELLRQSPIFSLQVFHAPAQPRKLLVARVRHGRSTKAVKAMPRGEKRSSVCNPRE
jgi:hypothetical protein